MPRKKASEKESMEAPQGEAIVLVGQPGSLRGEFHLENPGEQRMVFRGARMSSVMAPAAARAALEAVPVAQKLPSVIVKPGERRRVPLRMALSPTTPPGEYRAEIKLEERTWPVVMHVTEKVALDISPGQIVLHNEPGAAFKKQVVLTNLGNVPLAIHEVTAIPLDDELLNCRILRAVAAAVGEKEDEQTIDSVLTEFARKSNAALTQSGILRVRNLAGSFSLAPGEVRSIELEFRLPETLDKRTRYRALLPIYTDDLVILIAPSLDGQPKK